MIEIAQLKVDGRTGPTYTVVNKKVPLLFFE